MLERALRKGKDVRETYEGEEMIERTHRRGRNVEERP